MIIEIIYPTDYTMEDTIKAENMLDALEEKLQHLEKALWLDRVELKALYCGNCLRLQYDASDGLAKKIDDVMDGIDISLAI